MGIGYSRGRLLQTNQQPTERIIIFHLISGWKSQCFGRIMRGQNQWHLGKRSKKVKLFLPLSFMTIDIVSYILHNNINWIEKQSVGFLSFPMMKNIFYYKLNIENYCFAILKMVSKMIFLLRERSASILLIKCHRQCSN